MVLKITALAPAPSTPAAAARASWSMWTLQGVTWLHVEHTPICGLRKSSREKPTACSIARPAARAGPSTTAEEYRRALVFFEVAAARRVGIDRHFTTPTAPPLESRQSHRQIARSPIRQMT